MSSHPRTPAFFASLTLHALLVGVVLWFAYDKRQKSNEDTPKIFELVMGEGDNFAATEAPALGTPGGGIKIEIPGPPTPTPSPVEAAPPEPEPSPVEPAPPAKPASVAPPVKTPPKAAPAPKEYKPVNMAKMVDRIADKRAANIEKKIKAEQKAADDRAAKEAALNAKRMTKEDFDRQNKGKSSSSQTLAKSGGGTGATKRIDAEGIAKGVVGGSTANKIGGAGGTVLTREDIELSEAYISLLKMRLMEAHKKCVPTGLSDLLQATVKFRLTSSGTVVGVTIIGSSRNDEYDRSVLEAFRRITLPRPPSNLKTNDYELTFKMKEIL